MFSTTASVSQIGVPPREHLELDIPFSVPQDTKPSPFRIEMRLLNKLINHVSFFLFGMGFSIDLSEINTPKADASISPTGCGPSAGSSNSNTQKRNHIDML
jgi:hypothetical protein